MGWGANCENLSASQLCGLECQLCALECQPGVDRITNQLCKHRCSLCGLGCQPAVWTGGQLCGPGVSCENGVPAQARLRLDGVSAPCLLHVLLFITLMFSSSNFNKSRSLNQTVFTQPLCCRIEDVFLWCEEKKMSLRIRKPSLGTGQNFWNNILKGKNIYTRRFICSYLLNAYYMPDIV